MARPREFDESAVLDAAVLCFWKQGYEATSVRDLVEHTGIAAASLYNAFGDKRALYEKALDHYVEDSIADRIRRCKSLPPLRAIEAFFEEIVKRSLDDRARKGCMLVNAALDVAPHDPAFRKVVAKTLVGIEGFFQARVRAGQADGTIARTLPAGTLAQNLLGVLMGIRVLARVRPERALLEGIAAAALAHLRIGVAESKLEGLLVRKEEGGSVRLDGSGAPAPPTPLVSSPRSSERPRRYGLSVPGLRAGVKRRL